MSLDARIAVVTTREKTFRLSVFWIKVQRSVKDYIILKKCFSPNTSTHSQNAGFANLAKVFTTSRKNAQNRKKSEFFSFQKSFSIFCSLGYLLLFCQPWKNFPPLSRKLQKLSERPEVFKTSFEKCCSVSFHLDT